MGSFSELGFRVKPPKQTLLFLLGLFSTIQILQVAGFAVSTYLAVLTAGYLLLTQGFDFRRDWHLLGILFFTGVTFTVSMLSDLPAGYKTASLTATIQWGILFIICAYMRKETSDGALRAFARGFDWSCRLQLVWCILQMGAWYGLGTDLNAKVFGDWLGMQGQTSQYRQDVLACTGLHWHAANLIPVLVYTYFRYKNLFIKLLCLALTYLTKNATSLVALVSAVVLELLLFAKRTLCDRRCALSHRIAVYILLVLGGLLAVSPILLPKVAQTIEYLLLRVYQIWNPTVGNESSAVHFNYYKNLPYILQNIPLREVLFGSGIGTSGYRFSFFYQQYTNQIWSVESDFVDAVLSRGVVGMLLQYSLLLRIAWRMARRNRVWVGCVMLVLLVCGFIYDNQFPWVQLLGYLFYCSTYQKSFTKESKLWVRSK